MKISLLEYITDQQEKLRAFELYWKHAMQSNPKDFPSDLEKGDWDERFDFFCEEV